MTADQHDDAVDHKYTLHDPPVEPTRPVVYTTQSPQSKDHHALHHDVSSKLKAAMGRAMPRMEIRFRDLSLSADVTISSTDENDTVRAKSELPTLPNEVKRAFRAMRAKKHVEKKQILHEISGVFRPGTMTLILGQPGSGKSSLLKMLSGRFPHSKTVNVGGEITYNGKPKDALTSHLPQFVAYVTQHDRHFGTLTVRETFEYAHKFSGTQLPKHITDKLTSGSADEIAEAQRAVDAMFAHYPDLILQQLGLENCQDTMIGDAMTRGVSGGEKKRVTLGEMEFGLKYVTMMDEVSTGLDSAATYDIVKTQRSIADKFQKTIVMSLLQPAPEVVALFDDIMLLNEGHVMYYGPRDGVEQYFLDLGFVRPAYRDLADFLMDLGTNQQAQYEPQSTVKRLPRHAYEFGAIYKSSGAYAKILEELDEPHDHVLLKDVEDHIDPMPMFQQSYWENTLTLLGRQLKIALRNRPFLAGRAIMVVVMGMLYSTVFYQLEPRNIQLVMGMIFSAVMFLGMGQFSEMPSMLAAREVYYKQRRANFIRASSYVVSFVTSQFPVAIIETIVFGSLTYWMCGLANSWSSFLIFELVLFLTNAAMTSWFMLIAAWSPDLHVAEPTGLVSLLIFILFAGFVLFKSQMPSFLVWLHWIDPLGWSLRALAINQYRSSVYDVCIYEDVNFCASYGGRSMGEYYLSFVDVPVETHWIYYGIIYLVGAAVAFMTVTALLLEYRRHESPEHHTVSTSKKEQDREEDEGTVNSPYNALASPKTSPGTSPGTSVAVSISPTRNFVPVTLAFQDLRYSVPDPQNPKESLELLKGITGFARPGTMTALMGSSGAGKTTLMDVIAGRKTGGKVGGRIMMNGHIATEIAIRRATGYCQQTDVHLESATFREALTFSAFLRQSSDIPDSVKYDSVNECLDLLDMNDIADRVIRGATIEQSKRLTIGIELAAQPSVIFLDEPTSGLDARSAKVIMDGVRKVADSGRTIVCTIHQPSAEVFYLFDSLLLLKKGGETVFFGELGKDCRNLVDYFEGIRDVKPLPEAYNPATWMLECIGAGVTNEVTTDVDFVEYFNASEHRKVMDTQMDKDGVIRPSASVGQITFERKRAASSATQFRFLLKRSMELYWRTASYNLTRLVISVALALLFWLVFGGAEYTTYQGINSGIGMVFLTSIFSGFVAFSSVLPIASEERAVFYRERAAETYSAFWYFIASTIVEIPYVFVCGLLFTAIFFPAVGFDGIMNAVLYWLNTSLLMLMNVYFGQFLAYALPSIEVATIIGVLLNSVFFLFMGFAPPAASIPAGYKWLYHATPLKYPFAILSALAFAECDVDPSLDVATGQIVVGSSLGCQVVQNAPDTLPPNVTVKMFTEEVFGMKHDEIWTNFVIVLGFIGLFRLLGLLALRYINHEKR